MNILSALLGEHAVLKQQIDHLERGTAGLSDERLRSAALLLAGAVESHATIEDELLFVPLEASGRMPAGPVAAMRREHEAIEALIAQVSEHGTVAAGAAGAAAPLRPVVGRLAQTLLAHFGHEEHALFALAVRVLDAATLDELGARWAARRSVAVGSVRALASA